MATMMHTGWLESVINQFTLYMSDQWAKDFKIEFPWLPIAVIY